MGSQLNGYLRDEIFRIPNRPHDHLFRVPEHPNHQIEVRLRLAIPISETVFRDLDIALNRDGNLRITHTDQLNNVITVTGTPPDNGYNAQRVLEVVRLHDNGAQLIPPG